MTDDPIEEEIEPALSLFAFDDHSEQLGHTLAPRVLGDDLRDPIVMALDDIVSAASDAIDTSTEQLIAQPGICNLLVSRLQEIGKTWDTHEGRPGRQFYVKALLAVASLSRVVEWREAEKNFWDFDDEGGGNGKTGSQLGETSSEATASSCVDSFVFITALMLTRH